MDRNARIGNALFTALCIDLGLEPDADGDRFNPFPRGNPPGVGRDEFTRRQLLTSAFKKTEVESSPTAESETLDAFLAANTACSKVTATTLSDVDDVAVGYSIAQARQILYRWFDTPDDSIGMASIERAAQFGPGQSLGLSGQPPLSYFKIGDCAHTAGSDFIRAWYELSVANNPLCEAAEMARKARWGAAQVRDAGNLSFVPKSYAKKRIVVTEPTLSTFFQLGLGSELARVLQEQTGINFTTQPEVNQALAALGSACKDDDQNHFCTMDLTQCSDYISIALAKYMFPANIFQWFMKLRTPYVSSSSVDIGDKLELHMLSTMGNGFTFPMQTVLLSALVLGVYDTLGIQASGIFGRNWGVFGDDIIVTEPAYHLLAKVLATLGLKVNSDKSFWTGPFRESCGADYYEGVNVRGVYLRRYSSDQDLASCFNRLSIWSAKHNIELKNTLVTILSFMSEILIVPPDEQFTAGIMMPYPLVSPEDGLWRYRAWHPKLSSFSFEPWELYEQAGRNPYCSKRHSFKRWIGDLLRLCHGSINEPAAFKVLLAGGLRRGKVSLKPKNLQYRVDKMITPRWGFSPLEDVPDLGTSAFDRWAEIVYLATWDAVSIL